MAPPQQLGAGPIDPMTGQPYSFSGVGNGSFGLQGGYGGRSLVDGSVIDQFNNGPTGGMASYTPEFLQALGYTGAAPNAIAQGVDSNGYDPAGQAEFQKFLQDKGLRLGLGTTNEQDNQYRVQAFDQANKPVGTENKWSGNDDPGNLFLMAMLGATGFGAASALGAGAVGASAAGGTGGSGGVGAELGGMGLEAGAPGAGGTLGQGAIGGSMAGANGALLDPAAYSMAPGSITYPAAGGGGVTWGAGSGALEGAGSLGAGAVGAGGLLGTGVTLSQLGSTAGDILKFAGSPAGGALLGAVGGGLGNAGGLNSATSSVQNKLDPRIAQYIYGPNGTSGVAGDVNTLYKQQLAQGGLNDTQRMGLNNQLSVLNAPGYQTGFNQMRAAGSGLLANPIAGNPFTSGQAALAHPQMPGQMPAQMQNPYAPRMQIPQRPSGLLGG